MTNAQQIVDDWNARHPVGTLVEVYRLGPTIEGPLFQARTKGNAIAMNGRTPMVALEGKAGPWLLRAIKVVEVGE